MPGAITGRSDVEDDVDTETEAIAGGQDMGNQLLQGESKREAYHIMEIAKTGKLIGEANTLIEDLRNKLEHFMVEADRVVKEPEDKVEKEPKRAHSPLVVSLESLNEQFRGQILDPLGGLLDRIDV